MLNIRDRVFTIHLRRGAGFTLIELAIVMVIVGTLVAFGVALVGPLTKRAKHNETKEVVNAAVESVIGFASEGNKTPNAAEFSTGARNPKDVWGKNLHYISDANLGNLDAGGVCGRRTTGITVRNCTNADCTSSSEIANVAFLVISGAGNYNIQTGNAGGRVTVYAVGTKDIDDYPADIDQRERYDDIVKWVTLNELRIKAGCVGPQLKILNNELSYGYEGSEYKGTVYADGGVPFSGGRYEWCKQGNLPRGLTANSPVSPANCSEVSIGQWGQSKNLTISGVPAPLTRGNHIITFFVRDNDNNIAQRTLVLTINHSTLFSSAPPPPPSSCENYRVWNATGRGFDFMVSGACRRDIGEGAEITTTTLLLEPGGVIDRHRRTSGCAEWLQRITFNDARTADTDKDCQVNLIVGGVTDR